MPSQQHPQAQPTSGPRPLTLAIASASSVVAAIVVSKIWGPGTIIGAAVTPVIVTLVGELLKKPAEKITVVRVSPTGTEVHERTAPSSPSERGASPSSPSAPGMSARSEHRSLRRPLTIALATGLLAFVIGAVVLTSSELVFGSASVASGGKRTTLVGGPTKESRRKQKQKPATPTTSPKVETKTTIVPAPTIPTTTVTAPTTSTEPVPPTAPTDPAPTAPAPGTGPTAP